MLKLAFSFVQAPGSHVGVPDVENLAPLHQYLPLCFGIFSMHPLCLPVDYYRLWRRRERSRSYFLLHILFQMNA